jgi:4-hydroxyphenylacetate 3-monooxygenase
MKTSESHLEGIRDGREVYLGGERIDDVTTHPAFAESARSLASLYDITSSQENEDRFTYEEDGGRHSLIFKRPKSVEDLAARRALHETWAAHTFGLMGRSPDHVAGFITGMAAEPAVFDLHDQGFGAHIVDYWRHIRDNDLYVVYAVVPPTGTRTGEAVVRTDRGVAANEVQPAALRVVGEDDSGVTVRGFKILATGALFADEVLVGNLLPLGPGEEQFAVTFALPLATPGLKIISRKPFAQSGDMDGALGTKFDESDAVLFFDDVKVPWERVFAHDKLDTSIAIFYETPGHSLGNAQSHIRLLAKWRAMLGILKKVTEANQIAAIPAVRERMAGLAVSVAVLEGLIRGQEIDVRTWPAGHVSQNRQLMYATLSWTCDTYPQFADTFRDLLGSSPFQAPARDDVFQNEYTAELLSSFLQLQPTEALDRYRLVKLAWDFVGTEFAARHLQYETLYAGPQHVRRGRAGHFFDWSVVDQIADECLESVKGAQLPV